jgi:outer membrane protein assembly factor BamB
VAESSNPDIASSQSGTANLSKFFENNQARLVSYDLKTGAEKWSKPLEQLSDDYEHIMFLMAADGVLVSVRTGYVQQDPRIGYRFETYETSTGKPIWQKDMMSDKETYAPLSYGKNMQAAHPTIMSGKIYWLAHTFGTMFCYDLQTGEDTSDTAFGGGWQNKGCAPPTSSNAALYYRHTYSVQYSMKTKKQEPILMIGRPSCWMSIISSGGLLLNPEAGSGCTCGLPMSISTGMSPRDW